MTLLPEPFSILPLGVTVRVTLERRERARCTNCGKRRILFRLASATGEASASVCARCAGVR